MLKAQTDLLSYCENIINALHEPLMVLDSDLIIVSANRNFYESFKTTPKKTIGRLIYDLGGKKWDIPELRTLLAKILSPKNKPGLCEVDHVFPVIGRRIMLFDARRVTGKKTGADWILLAIQDVTKQRRQERLLKDSSVKKRLQADKAIAASEEHYRLLAENASDVIWTMDMNLRFTYVSPSITRLRGYSVEEAMKTPIEKTLTPTSLALAAKYFAEELLLEQEGRRGRQATRTVELEEICKDGSIIWTEVGMTFLRDDKGVANGIIGVTRNITDRKRAQDALRKSESQLANAVKIAHLGPWEYDVASNLFTFTDAFYAIFRTTAAHVGGYTMSPADYARRFVHPEDAHLVGETIRKMIETNDPSALQVEHRIIYSDGEAGCITVRIFMVQDENGKTTGAYGVNQDITERKRAEDALRQMEEKYRQVVETAHEFIVTTDLNNKITFVNKSTRELFEGVDLVGMDIMDHTPPKLRQKQEELMSKRREGNGETFSFEWEIITKTGRIMITDIQSQLIKKDGEPAGVLFIGRDVTESRRAEDALKESEKKYREFYNFLPLPIYEMDFEANVTSANPAALKAFRGTREDLKKGIKVWQLLSPEDVERSKKNIESLLRGHKIEDTEYNLMRLDGSVFPAIVISSVIYSGEKPMGLRGAIIDITESKRVGDELRANEEKYRLVVDNAIESIFIAQEGRIKFANRRMVERLGYPMDVLTLKPFIEFIYPDDRELVVGIHTKRMKGEEVPSVYSFRAVTAAGTVRWVELNAVIINWEGHPATLNFLNDVTERRQAGEDLQKSFARTRAALGATVRAMAALVETRDPYTAGHQRRVSDLARKIATEMGLSTDRIDGIRTAGTIHDIGKLSIPAEILSKPRKLTEIEYSLIETHPQSGYDILKDIDFPWPIARMILEHHERMNGSGYPNRLKGDQTLLESRIISVSDVVEAMASHRPYRPGLGLDAALDEITANRGKLYDPAVVDVCLKLFKEKNYKLPD